MDNNTTNNNAVDLKSLNIAGNTTNSTATENTTSANPSAEDPNSKEYKESLANDSIALAYDYYDRYYENVLSKLELLWFLIDIIRHMWKK